MAKGRPRKIIKESIQGEINIDNPSPEAKLPDPTPIEPTQIVVEPTIAEQHEAFKEGMKQSMHEITLEDPITAPQKPYSWPKIERAYTTDGIVDKPGQEAINPTQPQSTTSKPTDFKAQPPSSVFKADKPPKDDPKYAATQKMDDKPNSDPFNVPTGNASELVDWGAQTLNYAIGKFGGLITDVKIIAEMYSIPGVIERVKKHNERSLEALKLNKEEIEMLRKPLVAIMNEKGIRGLTNGEKLLMACGLIVMSKVKIFIEIKKQNRVLVEDIRDMIRASDTWQGRKPPQEPNEPIEPTKPIQPINNNDIPLTPTEEEIEIINVI